MTDKAGWEVEGFIDRLTRRDETNSERLVLEAISHLRAFAHDCDALRESNREATDEIERLRHEARYGTHLMATAKSLGWKNDGGEGPQEFLSRRTREVALEDCADEIERLRTDCDRLREFNTKLCAEIDLLRLENREASR